MVILILRPNDSRTRHDLNAKVRRTKFQHARATKRAPMSLKLTDNYHSGDRRLFRHPNPLSIQNYPRHDDPR